MRELRRLDIALAALQEKANPGNRDGMARFGIIAPTALGVRAPDIQAIAKRLGRDHDLAAALWSTGIHEARSLAAFVDDPNLVTPSQMDRWARDFTDWSTCDCLCIHLFDRTPHAWSKPAKWAASRHEFVKRAAFALLAGLAVHDRDAQDRQFLDALPLIEAASIDPRNFVKKGVNWALRQIGKRNLVLNSAAAETARRLADSPDASARWAGKDALREFARPATLRRLAAKATWRSSTES
jgi:3-methyladenine DNA glycosylase AlkD